MRIDHKFQNKIFNFSALIEEFVLGDEEYTEYTDYEMVALYVDAFLAKSIPTE